MPLFYFDINDGVHVVSDDVGQWFPSVQAAQAEAAVTLSKTIRETGKDRLTLIIRDANGDTLTEAEATLRIILRKGRDDHA